MDSRFDRVELVDRLRAARPAVLPSLLLCDFGALRAEVEAAAAAGGAAMHLDIMDGHFVPNITYGLPIVETVRQATDLPLDVHLMITDPGRSIHDFRSAGADMLTIHAEAVDDPRPLLEEIRASGASAGLAINPPTPVDKIDACLPYCDLVLVMSVMPGYGGQQFDESVLTKVRALAARDDVNPLLEMDGGIAADTIGRCAEAGVELFVVGSAIFRSQNYQAAVEELRAAARS